MGNGSLSIGRIFRSDSYSSLTDRTSKNVPVFFNLKRHHHCFEWSSHAIVWWDTYPHKQTKGGMNITRTKHGILRTGLRIVLILVTVACISMVCQIECRFLLHETLRVALHLFSNQLVSAFFAINPLGISQNFVYIFATLVHKTRSTAI